MVDQTHLRRWAADTWRCLDAMCDSSTGLPADWIASSLDPASRSGYTSPTNIGGYLWSTVGARDLGLIDTADCRDRCATTLGTLERLWRHDESGMYANWYSEATGELLTSLPDSSDVFVPFMSSVDNGWLAAALIVVAAAVPELSERAEALGQSMNFAVFHDASARGEGPGGALRGGFWSQDPGQPTMLESYVENVAPVHHTMHHYDLLCSEPRIASYIGISRGQIPGEHLAALSRKRRQYRGHDVIATFGGSMFEELMPDLFVPEAQWSPLWKNNHEGAVAAHREYALDEQGYHHWGFSPCALPTGGYGVFGVPPIAFLDEGYPSEQGNQVVVTPHASAMALMYEPNQAYANLTSLEQAGCYGPGGFLDSFDDRSGLSAERHLSLDQSMIFAALMNVLDDNALRRWFCTSEVEQRLRPAVAALDTSDRVG